jgi:GABA(A) receptor-associated protein
MFVKIFIIVKYKYKYFLLDLLNMPAKDIIKQIDNSAHPSHKSLHTFEQRLRDSSQIILKYPYRIPVICEKHCENINLTHLPKKKFLIPFDFTIAQFLFIIRKFIYIHPNEAIFICIGNVIPPSTTLFNNLYHHYKDTDGYLYLTYTTENTFG